MVRALTLRIERTETLWVVTSDELSGLLIAERSLTDALAQVEPIARRIVEALEDEERQGRITAAGAAQLEEYRAALA